MENYNNIKIKSKEFLQCDSEYIVGLLDLLGIDNIGQISDMRVFDLLNLNGVSANRAESIVLTLYRFFHNNAATDEAIYNGQMDQNYNYAAWHRKHRNYKNVKLRDLFEPETINEKAISHLMRIVIRAFYKSEEYSAREYRYLNLDDYLADQNEGKEA